MKLLEKEMKGREGKERAVTRSCGFYWRAEGSAVALFEVRFVRNIIGCSCVLICVCVIVISSQKIKIRVF